MGYLFYVTLLVLLVGILGVLFFADWWNKRHGVDGSGKPLRRSDSEPAGNSLHTNHSS